MLVQAHQPSTFFSRLVSLLSRFHRVSEREAFLIEALYPDAKQVLNYIRLDGNAYEFATHCAQIVNEYDCRLLGRLLDALEPLAGVSSQKEVAALRELFPAYCQQFQSNPQATTPIVRYLFINHSDRDIEFAQRLRSDLQQRGHPCHLASENRQDAQNWVQAMQTAIDQSYMVLTVISATSLKDQWVKMAYAYLFNRSKLIPKRSSLITTEVVEIPEEMERFDQLSIDFHTHYEDALTKLLTHLPALQKEEITTTKPILESTSNRTNRQRAAEKAYLNQLKLRELRHVASYTPLSGEIHMRRTHTGSLVIDPVVARTEFEYIRRRIREDQPLDVERFENVIDRLKKIRRAVLIGDPGAGKTSTLYKLAADLTHTALNNPRSPIPLLIRLGNWRDKDESLHTFLKSQLNDLGIHLDDLLRDRRAALLLDGLNELPIDQLEHKAYDLERFLAQYHHLLAFISCRIEDYKGLNWRFDQVKIAPLDPLRIHEYVDNYLGLDKGSRLFWRLVGERTKNFWQDFALEMADKIDYLRHTFWSASQLPYDLEWGKDNQVWKQWIRTRDNPAGLLGLAKNPYMLYMIVEVYVNNREKLPPNRGTLFDRFVEMLLLREGLYLEDETLGGTLVLSDEGKALFDGLIKVAEAMQNIRIAERGRDPSALTTISLTNIQRYLTEDQLYKASAANLLTIDSEARFSHQLLQEYFAAQALKRRIFDANGNPKVKANTIWSGNWWESTGWEETAILLTGLFSNDASPVLRWLSEAQPELTARCIIESGASVPDATLVELRDRWLPRLTNEDKEPELKARATIGRALGRLTLKNGLALDNRPGVGVRILDGQLVPEIMWSKPIPTGHYSVGRRNYPVSIVTPYYLSVYPVTHAQFQCFLDASDLDNTKWWKDTPMEQEDFFNAIYHQREFGEQGFPFGNHPRENVSWYEAIAFCRWLSDKLGYFITLPHEQEWEIAARYPDNRDYPWGEQFQSTLANTSEDKAIAQTTAVGLYPGGVNPHLGLHDLNGNVWEWCLNKLSPYNKIAVDDSNDQRTLAGGSWRNLRVNLRAADSIGFPPNVRANHIGFSVNAL